MQAAKLDIVVEQHSTFSLPITIKTLNLDGSTYSPIDLTGYTARGKIRQKYDTPVLVSFSPQGEFDATGKLTMYLTAEETMSLRIDSGVYDIELVQGAIVTRILQGKVTMSRSVSYE